jgi:hypothetical protein
MWNIDDSVWWQYLYSAEFLLFILVLWDLGNKFSRRPFKKRNRENKQTDPQGRVLTNSPYE